MKHDVIVVGSGDMACATALEAAKRGLGVAWIDDHLGSRDDAVEGTSVLRWKIREAISNELASRELLGYDSSPASRSVLPQQAIQRLRRRLLERYYPAMRGRLEMYGVREISGRARFVSRDGLLLDSNEVHEAPTIVIAAGSRPRHPRRFRFDQRIICDSHSVTRFDLPPRHLLIVGAEAVGLEVACMFAALGSNVTVLDRRRQTLRYVDRMLREVLYSRLQSMGIDLILGEELEEIGICGSSKGPHAEVRLSSGRVEASDRVLIDAGRSPNTETLGLKDVGVQTDERGFIITDQYQQTSQRGVYAVGDVIGNLGQVDMREPAVAIQHALGTTVELSEPTPLTIQTTPPISMHGLTEEMCQRLDLPHTVGVARYSDLSSLQVLGTGEGMLKLVVSSDDRRLLGVHLIGEGANDLVHVGTAFVSSGASIDELANYPYVAHSLFEAYIVAAEDARRRLAPMRVAEVHGK